MKHPVAWQAVATAKARSTGGRWVSAGIVRVPKQEGPPAWPFPLQKPLVTLVLLPVDGWGHKFPAPRPHTATPCHGQAAGYAAAGASEASPWELYGWKAALVLVQPGIQPGAPFWSPQQEPCSSLYQSSACDVCRTVSLVRGAPPLYGFVLQGRRCRDRQGAGVLLPGCPQSPS